MANARGLSQRPTDRPARGLEARAPRGLVRAASGRAGGSAEPGVLTPCGRFADTSLTRQLLEASIVKSIKNAIAAAAIAAIVAAPAAANEVWSMATSWGGGPFLEEDAKGFAKLVNTLTDGRISIDVFPGGTLGKALKVSDTVKSGVAQVGHTWMGYDWGIDKTTVIFANMAGGLNPEELIIWLYQAGGRGALVRVPHGPVRGRFHPLRHLPHRDLPALEEADSDPRGLQGREAADSRGVGGDRGRARRIHRHPPGCGGVSRPRARGHRRDGVELALGERSPPGSTRSRST